MLTLETSERPDIETCLKHEWFREEIQNKT